VAGPFRIDTLGPAHERKQFSSGVDALDRYFRERVTQDVKRRVCHCFVACGAPGQVAGYYTLAATSLPLAGLSQNEARRLPRYPLLPAALIGRLAIDHRFRGQGLGGALVIDAARRAARSEAAVYAMVVDAKDDSAASFYVHLGFRRFVDRPGSLYLPLATALKA
jgi:GNAT superfamily N-acetyltransferase